MTTDQHVDDRLARLGQLVSGTIAPARERSFFEQHLDEHDITALTPDVAQPLLADFGVMKSGGERLVRERRQEWDAQYEF